MNFMYSIIIPIYNAEFFIRDSVASILKQSYKNYEILLIDDGSSDAGGDICDELARCDNRINVLHQKNAGAASARNRGIKIARGDYILFLDSDDYWAKEDFLEQVNQRLSMTKPDVLSFNYAKMKNGSFVLSPYFSKNIFNMPKNLQPIETSDYIFKNNLWVSSSWNKVVKKSLFDTTDLLYIEGILAEDIDWCFRLGLAANTFDYFGEIGVIYRIRDNSISHMVNSKLIFSLERAIQRCLDLFNEYYTESKEFLKPYIAYQVATFLAILAEYEDHDAVEKILETNMDKLAWLKVSNNWKVRALCIGTRLVGVKNLLKLLRVRTKLLKIH